jgi:uroporphyrinogen-III decarboxylase
MSLPQFEKFYWPQLKALQVGLVGAGIQPFVFYEGIWGQRLTYLTELPKGKTAGLFQSSDIFKVKEVVGETMRIMGGMPNSLLEVGTAEEVRSLTNILCETIGKGGGYIMSNGVGELEGSRPELVKVWVEATKDFGVYRQAFCSEIHPRCEDARTRRSQSEYVTLCGLCGLASSCSRLGQTW